MSYVARIGDFMSGDFMSGDFLTWIRLTYIRMILKWNVGNMYGKIRCNENVVLPYNKAIRFISIYLLGRQKVTAFLAISLITVGKSFIAAQACANFPVARCSLKLCAMPYKTSAASASWEWAKTSLKMVQEIEILCFKWVKTYPICWWYYLLKDNKDTRFNFDFLKRHGITIF